MYHESVVGVDLSIRSHVRQKKTSSSPIPSGKHTKNYGKIHPFFMGKLTMNGPFSIAM